MGERERQQLDKILTAIANDSRETFGDKLEAVILYGSYAGAIMMKIPTSTLWFW